MTSLLQYPYTRGTKSVLLYYFVTRGHYCHVRHSDGKVSWAKCDGGCYERKGNEVIECPPSTAQPGGGSIDVIDTDYEDYDDECGEVKRHFTVIFQDFEILTFLLAYF